MDRQTPDGEASAIDAGEVIYVSNSFPSAVEPYVGEEIAELRRCGARVLPSSIWRSGAFKDDTAERFTFTVFTWRPWEWLAAVWLCVRRRAELQDTFRRLLRGGTESWDQRIRGFAHTALGARLALQLKGRGVRHIHVHHGYLAAWSAMVAARLLRVSYSLTLHGSDLLVRPLFLDIKLEHCALCFTVSEFNRDHLLRNFPEIDPEHVVVQRIGVPIPGAPQDHRRLRPQNPFTLLAVGRLHAVKDHAFLARACAALKASGERLRCRIAGEGPERRRLEELIRKLGLTEEVELLGHIPRDDLAALYREADLVVLTSQSEGIPLTLMEAMAAGRPVLAPSITGIPELVRDGKTGFLFRQGSLTEFVERVQFVRGTYSALGPICEAAREHVRSYFDREKNLQQFSSVFMERILGAKEGVHADSVLQQIQL